MRWRHGPACFAFKSCTQCPVGGSHPQGRCFFFTKAFQHPARQLMWLASWCDASHFSGAWLDRQPSESLSRLLLGSRPEGQPGWWPPVCTGDAAPHFWWENGSFQPLFLTCVWRCDYSEGLPSPARKSARLPCFWEVLNQKLLACELFATDNLLAGFFLLLEKCIRIAQFLPYTVWFFRCDWVFEPLRPLYFFQLRGNSGRERAALGVQPLAPWGWLSFATSSHTAWIFRNTKAT